MKDSFLSRRRFAALFTVGALALTGCGASGSSAGATAAESDSAIRLTVFPSLNALGARVAEADGFFDAPPRNPALEQALGVTTGAAPSRIHVSPLLGFSYTYNRDKENGSGTMQNNTGRFYRTTAGVIRGGIGEFRDLLRPNLLADASAATGLSGGTTPKSRSSSYRSGFPKLPRAAIHTSSRAASASASPSPARSRRTRPSSSSTSLWRRSTPRRRRRSRTSWWSSRVSSTSAFSSSRTISRSSATWPTPSRSCTWG